MMKIKKIIKWFFIMLGILVLLLIGLIVLIEMKIIKIPKEPIPILKNTQFDKIEEWYDVSKKCPMIKAKYTFDGLNGIGYYEQQKLKAEQLFNEQASLETAAKEKNLQSYLNSRMIDSNLVPNNPELDNLSQKIMKNRDELIEINQKLVLDRLQSQPEPPNLACYIKDRHPFDRWNKDGVTYDMTTANGFKFSSFDTNIDSYLYVYVNFKKQQHKGPGGNYLILEYQGPKHFLTEDQDYYLGRARVDDADFKLTNFYLHFNPVRRTLSLFKNKHHNNKADEAEYLSKTNNDW
ncbi:MAG: SAP53-like protein [Candidatus Phytoplasma citri]|nr:MAG: SAP53-like protein [Candidatus Phytoplasma aurantifolia]